MHLRPSGKLKLYNMTTEDSILKWVTVVVLMQVRLHNVKNIKWIIGRKTISLKFYTENCAPIIIKMFIPHVKACQTNTFSTTITFYHLIFLMFQCNLWFLSILFIRAFYKKNVPFFFTNGQYLIYLMHIFYVIIRKFGYYWGSYWK